MIISDDSAEETFVLIRDCCGMTFDMLQTAVNFAVQYLTLPLCDLCIRVNHIEGKGGTPETNRWSALSLDLKEEFVRRYGSVWYCSVDRNFVIMGHEQHSSYIDFIVDDIRIVLDGGGVARRLQSPPHRLMYVGESSRQPRRVTIINYSASVAHEMVRSAIKAAVDALRQHTDSSCDAAHSIKSEFDRIFGGSWFCAVDGLDLGTSADTNGGPFIDISVGLKRIVIFRGADAAGALG